MAELHAEVVGNELLLHRLHRCHRVVVIAGRVFLVVSDVHRGEVAEVLVGAGCNGRK
jgi:hypothetical protein